MIDSRRNKSVVLKFKTIYFTAKDTNELEMLISENIKNNKDHELIYLNLNNKFEIEEYSSDFNIYEEKHIKKLFPEKVEVQEKNCVLILPLKSLINVNINRDMFTNSFGIKYEKSIMDRLSSSKSFSSHPDLDYLCYYDEWCKIYPKDCKYYINCTFINTIRDKDNLYYDFSDKEVVESLSQNIAKMKVASLKIETSFSYEFEDFIFAILTLPSVKENLEFLSLKLKSLSTLIKIIHLCSKLQRIERIQLECYEDDDDSEDKICDAILEFKQKVGVISEFLVKLPD